MISFLSWDKFGNFVVLINGRRYEYEKVSPYQCKKLRAYIKFKNSKAFFNAIKQFRK